MYGLNAHRLRTRTPGSNGERESERARKAVHMERPMRTSSVLSSCSTRALCESALGMAIIE